METWKDFINGLDFELPEGEPPKSEEEKSAELSSKEPRRVTVQKIITEVWVYTDLGKNTFGTQTFQDVKILGEMDFERFAGLINKRKTQRRGKA